MKKVLIVGLGNMGGALARGLLTHDEKHKYELHLVDGKADARARYQSDSDAKVYETIEGCKVSADIVFLCVKPQDLPSVAATLAPFIHPGVAIVSLLAGITQKDIETALNAEVAVIRSMPNITATVSESATVLSCNEYCKAEQKDLATEIFTVVGEVYWSKEAHLDAVTGLSGSGPAYVYMVIEALTDGGVKMGLPRKLALDLATQTVIGAGKLVKESGHHPAILKDRVTTPGGTTIHAVHELESSGLRSMLISAVVTATEKSRELRNK